MDSMRQKKVSRLIQRDLGEIFMREGKEVTMGTMVSVTTVRISPDLGTAKVYLSIFPVPPDKTVFDHIKENASKIRYFLGKRAGKQLRVIPELQFYIDDSLDYIDNIDRLLKE